MTKGPVLFEMEEDGPNVADAPEVPDLPAALPQGQAMQQVAQLATVRPSRLGQLFWGVAAALLTAVLSASAWSFVTSWLERAPLFGWVLTGLVGAFVVLALGLALRELAALSRLKRIDGLRHDAGRAHETSDLALARSVTSRLERIYAGRADLTWGQDRFRDLAGDQFDADALLSLCEREMLAPLDRAAEAEVAAAARQVATVTALVPLALADVVAALTANIRMIRRIAALYGGRSGTLGAWRLTRAVLGHLVATGAVAVGDDMLEPLLGGSILGKVSRRFGEGMVNGALTARVGVAAIEVCRPLAFAATEPPKARDLVRQAVVGVWSSPDKHT